MLFVSFLRHSPSLFPEGNLVLNINGLLCFGTGRYFRYRYRHQTRCQLSIWMSIFNIDCHWSKSMSVVNIDVNGQYRCQLSISTSIGNFDVNGQHRYLLSISTSMVNIDANCQYRRQLSVDVNGKHRCQLSISKPIVNIDVNCQYRCRHRRPISTVSAPMAVLNQCQFIDDVNVAIDTDIDTSTSQYTIVLI